MKIFYIIVFLLIHSVVFGQSQVQVNIPTAKEEAAYIWRNIRDISFFEKHNYQVSMPKGPLMEKLKAKARKNQLTDEDYTALEKFVTDKVYRKADYEAGYKAIQKNLSLLNKMVNEIGQMKFKWPFKMYKAYQVNLTLYGPGGSYDPDRGSIIIFTTQDGRFKQYKNPINTLIHEITHIGIEHSIIRQYNVPHGLKERIVDTFVSLNFKQYLPNYRVQNMGDPKLDNYLKQKTDFANLETIVQKFVKKK